MEVAVHDTRYVRGIGHHREHLRQIKAVKAGSDVLLGFLILVIGIDLEALSVSGLQIQVGRNALVLCQEHIVVFIDLEFLVAKNGVFRVQTGHDSAVHHLCHGSELGTQTVLLVIEPQVHARAIRQKIAVEERVEYVLRIVLVVLYLPVIGHVCRI